MKKHFISFFVVLCISLSCLSFVVSAASVDPETLGFAFVIDLLDRAAEKIMDGDFENLIGKEYQTQEAVEQRLHEIYRQTAGYTPSSSGAWVGTGTVQYSDGYNYYLNDPLPDTDVMLRIIFDHYGYTGLPYPYHYMILVIDMGGNYQINCMFMFDYSDEAVFNYDIDYRGYPYVTCTENFTWTQCQLVSVYDSTYRCLFANGGIYRSDQCTLNYEPDNFYMYSTDLAAMPLSFISQFSTSLNSQLNIFLDANKVVDKDYFAVAGILYDDGSERFDGTDRGYINVDFINCKSLQGQQHFEWSYSLSDFETWAYRKRILDTDNFYAFVHVIDTRGEIIYSSEQHLDLSSPSNIFEDVQPIPDYGPYKPTPTTFPTFPDVTFDFTPNNNYTTYNYNTFNNYDNSQDFNEWLGDTITTINNNISGGLDNIDHNLKVIGDNINNFTREVKNYIEGSSSDLNEYIGDLIKKFNTDFNNWTDSSGKYLHDVLSTIDFNIQFIADNILNFLKSQFVPDEEYLDFLLMSCCPWYYQIRNLFSSSSSELSSFSLYLPGLDYTYVFDDADLASQIRNVLTYCLYAFTVVSCVRIGFQIFGIHYFSGGDGT